MKVYYGVQMVHAQSRRENECERELYPGLQYKGQQCTRRTWLISSLWFILFSTYVPNHPRSTLQLNVPSVISTVFNCYHLPAWQNAHQCIKDSHLTQFRTSTDIVCLQFTCSFQLASFPDSNILILLASVVQYLVLSHDYGIVSHDQGSCHMTVRLCHMTTGSCHMTVGSCHMTAGSCHMTRDVSHDWDYVT